MSTDKRKRVFIDPPVYADLIKIGSGGANSNECALLGISKAVARYQETENVNLAQYEKMATMKDIDEVVINNLGALMMLGKNANMDPDAINAKINEALKAIISEILGV